MIGAKRLSTWCQVFTLRSRQKKYMNSSKENYSTAYFTSQKPQKKIKSFDNTSVKPYEDYGDTNQENFEDKPHTNHRVRYKNKRQLKTEDLYVQPSCEPKDTSIFLFPGEMTQYVGMGRSLRHYPNVKMMYDVASEIAKVDLYKLSTCGPRDKLDRIMIQYPAILCASLAAVEKIRSEKPDSISSCIGTAGYGLGEIAALVFANVLTFEDAVHLAMLRAELVLSASEHTPTENLVAFCGKSTKLNLATRTAKEFLRITTLKTINEGIDEEEKLNVPGIEIDCKVTSHLRQGCKIVSGNSEAMKFLKVNQSFFEIKRLKSLPGSGVMNTMHMNQSIPMLEKFLFSREMYNPEIPVHSNFDGKVCINRFHIRENLLQTMSQPIKWETTMLNLYTRPKEIDFPNTFICGPGKSLKSILISSFPRAAKNCSVII